MQSDPRAYFAAVAPVRRDRCAICGGGLESAIELPGLPLTETYCPAPVEKPSPGIDQRLLYCNDCGHGQLEAQIAPDILYGANYRFRTSASATARKGTQFFLSVLDEAAPGRRFRCVLDLGCNDLHLLSRLEKRADVRIGVDPVWRGRESERGDPSIIVFGNAIEDMSALPEKPDLVLCRHVLEHIAEPRAVLDRLMEAAAPNALFVFEFPGLDGMIESFRFDQVFHQHLQYFSFASFLRLLHAVGADFAMHRENFHDWGAIAVAFTRAAPGRSFVRSAPRPAMPAISRRYGLFRRQMAAASEVLAELRGTRIYGYGAAQMLPVLAYHLGTDLSQLEAVLDDDPAKDGMGYWNLPVRVVHSSRANDIAQASVLVTAPDNVQPIMTRLLAMRPRHILYPFNVI